MNERFHYRSPKKSVYSGNRNSHTKNYLNYDSNNNIAYKSNSTRNKSPENMSHSRTYYQYHTSKPSESKYHKDSEFVYSSNELSNNSKTKTGNGYVSNFKNYNLQQNLNPNFAINLSNKKPFNSKSELFPFQTNFNSITFSTQYYKFKNTFLGNKSKVFRSNTHNDMTIYDIVISRKNNLPDSIQNENHRLNQSRNTKYQNPTHDTIILKYQPFLPITQLTKHQIIDGDLIITTFERTIEDLVSRKCQFNEIIHQFDLLIQQFSYSNISDYFFSSKLDLRFDTNYFGFLVKIDSQLSQTMKVVLTESQILHLKKIFLSFFKLDIGNNYNPFSFSCIRAIWNPKLYSTSESSNLDNKIMETKIHLTSLKNQQESISKEKIQLKTKIDEIRSRIKIIKIQSSVNGK